MEKKNNESEGVNFKKGDRVEWHTAGSDGSGMVTSEAPYLSGGKMVLAVDVGSDGEVKVPVSDLKIKNTDS